MRLPADNSTTSPGTTSATGTDVQIVSGLSPAVGTISTTGTGTNENTFTYTASATTYAPQLTLQYRVQGPCATNSATQTLTIKTGTATANLKGIDAAEFPHIPTVSEQNGSGLVDGSDGIAIELDPNGLRRMVDQVVFAASSDDSRPTLTGVEVTFHNSRITMAATDGYRLSVRSVELEQPFAEDLSLIHI